MTYKTTVIISKHSAHLKDNLDDFISTLTTNETIEHLSTVVGADGIITTIITATP